MKRPRETDTAMMAKRRLPQDPQAQVERFWAKVEPEPNSGCYLWVGAIQRRRHGAYGVFQAYGQRTTNSAHVFAYRMAKGALPIGTEIDHLCRNTQCVNPDHLEAVPRRVNLLRGQTLVAMNAEKTHCPKGHSYEGENVKYIFGRTGTMRVCRECLRQKARLRYWTKRGGLIEGRPPVPRSYARHRMAQ